MTKCLDFKIATVRCYDMLEGFALRIRIIEACFRGVNTHLFPAYKYAPILRALFSQMATRIIREERTLFTTFKRTFHEPWRSRIHDAVMNAHRYFESALFLSKLLLLERFEEVLHEHGDQFTHAVAIEFTRDLDLSSEYFKHLLAVVSSDRVLRKPGRPFHLDIRRKIQHYDDTYKKYAAAGLLPDRRSSPSNLSHVFSYMAVQMSTCYANNTWLHFDKYVKKHIRRRLETHCLSIHFEESFDHFYDLPTDEKKRVKKQAGAIFRRLFGHASDQDTTDLFKNENVDDRNFMVDLLYDVREFAFPQSVTANAWADAAELKPSMFLPYMMFINRTLEACDDKLYSPLPIRSHYTPGSILLDTNGLVDILIRDKNDLDQLKEYLTAKGVDGVEQITDKGKLYVASSPILKTHVWGFFTEWTSSQFEYGNRVFNNMMSTDGYKCSIHYVNRAVYGNTGMKKGIKIVTPKKPKHEFKNAFTLTQEERTVLLDDTSVIRLMNDPGKDNIVCIGTGVKGGPILNYTANQRRHETTSTRNKREYVQSLKGHVDEFTTFKDLVEHDSSGEGNRASKKSTTLTLFCAYLRNRKNVSDRLTEFFARSCHRRRKYRVKLGQRSSEDKLKNAIQQKFDPGGKRKIVIFWGNWGRNPNMSHQASTPGIGLRRRTAKRYLTYTIDERYTSSVCPECDSDLCHPKRRNRVNKYGISYSKEVHHLLRCNNGHCGRWWQRDVLAVANFNRQTTHILQTGCNHPVFQVKHDDKRSQKKC